MNRIGPILKEAREKRSVSLDDVHAKIKIHPRVLQLLEEEKFDKLPSPLFVKSFLRSYADFLEVNGEELVQQYEKSKNAPEPEQVLFIKPKDPAGEMKISAGAWTAMILAGVLVVFVLSGIPGKAVKGWTERMKEEQKIRQSERKQKEAAAKETKVKAKVEVAAPVAEEAASEWLQTPKMGNFPALSKKQPLELEIKALDAVWIHITADGQVIYQGILKKNASESWRANKSFEIWTGNASNMTMSLNKNSLGSPGKGVAKKMALSHEGIRVISTIAN